MTSASHQAGFDFSDNTQPIVAEDPAGTWLDTCLTTTQYRQHIPEAKDAAIRLDPLLRQLFLHAIDQIEPRLKEMAETIEDDGGAYPLWGIELGVSPEVWEAFASGCKAQQWAGCETRVRREAWCTVYAVYAPRVGSLVGHRWEDSYGLSYDVQRDAELRPSYLDDTPRWEVPAGLWRPLYSGQTIAESYDEPAGVRAFTFQGRRYIITGTLSKGRYCEARAWSIVAASDWRGPTYTYREQCRAWDEGRKERGDSRGLAVMIRGQRCILDSYTCFVDQNDDSHSCVSTEDDAGTTEIDEQQDEEDLEDLDLNEEAYNADA